MNSFQMRKTDSLQHWSAWAAAVLVSLLNIATAWADRWEFSEPIEIARQQEGVFHHLDSSGRKNISATANGTFIIWEDNSAGNPSIYLLTIGKDEELSTPLKVSGSGDAYEPTIQQFEAGHIIGWEESEQVWVRWLSGEGLGEPIRLSDQTAGQVSLTAGNKGEALVVWSEETAQYNRVMFATLGINDDRLQVIEERPLDIQPGEGDQNYPVIAYHEAMNSYVAVWEDRRFKNVMLFSAMGNSENGFSVGMQVNELLTPLSGLYGVATGVARASLSGYSDYVAAVWSDKRDFRSGSDVYAAFARHSGRFGENRLVQDGFAEGYEQWHPTIAGFGHELAVAWDDDRDGDSDIWLSYYQDGAWSDDIAVPEASGLGVQTHPSIAMDSKGGLHIAWIHRDQEGGTTSIRYIAGRGP